MARSRRPYRCSTVPSDTLGQTAITAQAAAPTEEARLKRAVIEVQQMPKARPTKRRASVKTAQIRYIGYSTYSEKIGLEVKVRGLERDTYWLTYTEAVNLWTQFSDEPFPSLV